MPNHVTTILTIDDTNGIPLEDIRATFVNDKGLVDFNVIKSAPKCLAGFEPHFGILSRANAALGLLPDPKTMAGDDITSLTNRMELSNALRETTTPARASDIPAIVRAIQNYSECGYMYWYDWNQEHWGTKWNCYGQPKDGHPADAAQFKFETAWGHPNDMMIALSERLPGVVFSVRYADEDTGSNCGEYRIKSGVRFDEDIAPRHGDQSPAEKKKWAEFAFRLCHPDTDPAAYGYGPDWEYSEDVSEEYERRQAGAAP